MPRLLGAVSKTVTIGSGDTLTAVIDTEAYEHVGVVTPAMLGAPTLTFQVSNEDDGTFYDLYDATGTADAVSLSVGSASARAFSSDVMTPLQGYRYLKAKASAAASADYNLIFFMKK
jgi:hypothetical protein